MSKFVYIWKYRIDPNYQSEFINAYKINGHWVDLFIRASGYLKTEFLQDIDNPDVFTTIDYWNSIEEFQSFKSTFKHEFDKLDQECEKYTLE